MTGKRDSCVLELQERDFELQFKCEYTLVLLALFVGLRVISTADDKDDTRSSCLILGLMQRLRVARLLRTAVDSRPRHSDPC